ncbi:MAG: amino acid racemase [Oscillospiraceae bacterium]|nr:amino acid racemase [Oscillospiraceae bacterium]
MYKRLGILGGMGPLATCKLYADIINSTPAKKDQDHIDMVILNACYIPDRTSAILRGEKSPLPYLLEGCKSLETQGCDAIAIPCNTSHYYFDQLQSGCKTEILNMVELTAKKLESAGIKKVYLMATEGTVKTSVYQKYFGKKDIEIISPTTDETAEMMKVIYEVKAGISPDVSRLSGMAREKGAISVLGCTELSALKFEGIEFIDSMEVLKDKILDLFLVGTKK